MAKRKTKSPKKTKPKLTVKQKKFCLEYLKDLNATQASIRAGYSKKTAQAIGSENLRKPLIAEYITKHNNKRMEKISVDAAWVLDKAVKLHDTCVEAKDNSNAARSLEIVGKHVDVLAFDTTVRHTGAEGGPIVVDNNLNVNWVDPTDKQPPK